MESEKAGVEEAEEEEEPAGRMEERILGGWNQDDHLGCWLVKAEVAAVVAVTGRATVTAGGRPANASFLSSPTRAGLLALLGVVADLHIGQGGSVMPAD